MHYMRTTLALFWRENVNHPGPKQSQFRKLQRMLPTLHMDSYAFQLSSHKFSALLLHPSLFERKFISFQPRTTLQNTRARSMKTNGERSYYLFHISAWLFMKDDPPLALCPTLQAFTVLTNRLSFIFVRRILLLLLVSFFPFYEWGTALRHSSTSYC